MSKEDYYIEIEDNNDDKFVLPSQRGHKEPIRSSVPKKGSSFLKRRGKLIAIIFIVALLYFFYTPILNLFLSILKQNPTVYSYYLHVEAQITNSTLIGLFYVSILGTIFFLILPTEAVFLYYLSSTDHTIPLIILIGLLGNLVGMTFNYLFGRILGEGVVKFLFKKNYEKYKEKIDNYGGYVLLFGNIFPGPIEVLAVFYGSFKFSYPRYLYLVFIGRLIKYLIITCLFIFFWDSITLYYNALLDSLAILENLSV